jgi:flagellar protein FliS
MQPKGPNPYLKTRIMTASPEELRLLLYDGAIKFCRQAKDALAAKDFDASFNAVMRAQKIVLELSTSLNDKAAPELCSRLSALYTYIYRKLVDANMSREPGGVDEPLKLLEFERETWRMLMEQTARQGRAGGAGPDRADVTNAQQTAMSSISTAG